MEGFKVVRNIWSDTVYKPVAAINSGIFYEVGKRTTPKSSGPLAVFDNLYDAEEFKIKMSLGGEFSKLQVFKVNYEPSRESNLWMETMGSISIMPISMCPDGTILAKWVELLEEV